jgi:hypothetical protein
MSNHARLARRRPGKKYRRLRDLGRTEGLQTLDHMCLGNNLDHVMWVRRPHSLRGEAAVTRPRHDSHAAEPAVCMRLSLTTTNLKILKSECDWAVMSSAFVASQSRCFFFYWREQIRVVENRLNVVDLHLFYLIIAYSYPPIKKWFLKTVHCFRGVFCAPY